MFDHEIAERKHFTGKDGITTYEHWCKQMGINAEDFPFRVKSFGHGNSGRNISLNVVSWGFYQGSDWSFYVFISYRTSDNKTTCAYHWDVDGDGKPVGTPRKHVWSN